MGARNKEDIKMAQFNEFENGMHNAAHTFGKKVAAWKSCREGRMLLAANDKLPVPLNGTALVIGAFLIGVAACYKAAVTLIDSGLLSIVMLSLVAAVQVVGKGFSICAALEVLLIIRRKLAFRKIKSSGAITEELVTKICRFAGVKLAPETAAAYIEARKDHCVAVAAKNTLLVGLDASAERRVMDALSDAGDNA